MNTANVEAGASNIEAINKPKISREVKGFILGLVIGFSIPPIILVAAAVFAL